MNGVAKITVDGQEVVLKFGMPAIRRIMEKMLQYQLVEKSDEDEIYNDLGLSHILFAGYLNGCEMQDRIPVLEFQSFYTLVEDGSGDKAIEAQILAAIVSFEDSKIVKQSIDRLSDTVEKKSRTNGTTSNHSHMESLASPGLSFVGQPGGNTY